MSSIQLAESESILASRIAPAVFRDASERLHDHILRTHWRDDVVLGPDPGIRLNARIGRFVKGYVPYPWQDTVVYMQAQGYWMMDNWLMKDLFGGDNFADVATACARQVVGRQRPEGYWEYPNREWKGRIATVEGCFASLGLLETFARTQDEVFLDAAIRWFHYVENEIGYRRQTDQGMLAINYFAHNTGDHGGVPNNSTMLLWVLARLAQLTQDESYLKNAAAMIRWLSHVQLETGELPYALGEANRDRVHFLCFQYNAFEFVDLVHYLEITGDESVMPILRPLAQYLSHGLTDDGCGRYDCLQDRPHVTYYTSAIAHALSQAVRLGLYDDADRIADAYRRVLGMQLPSGNMKCYSERNYGLLSDRRSYPRYLSMILRHFLGEIQIAEEFNQ